MPIRSDNSFKPKRMDVNCILLNGGVGDHIGSLVAIDYIIKTYPWINLLIWVPDFLLDFAKNLLPKKAIVRDFTTMRKVNGPYDRDKPTKTTEWDGVTSPMKMHSVDYAFLKLCDEVVSVDKKNYLKVKFDKVAISHYNLPEKYVVFTPAFTVGVREFSPKTVNELSDYVISKGYTPVYLGQNYTPSGFKHVIEGKVSEELDLTKGINLINKTSLLQVAKIEQGAAAVVGVDCGLLHVAGCTDAPIVAGFTTVRPEHRAPIRNNELGWNFHPVVPDVSLECRFCQSDTNFLYDVNYTKCMYGDYKCVELLNSAKYIEKLEKIL